MAGQDCPATPNDVPTDRGAWHSGGYIEINENLAIGYIKVGPRDNSVWTKR